MSIHDVSGYSKSFSSSSDGPGDQPIEINELSLRQEPPTEAPPKLVEPTTENRLLVGGELDTSTMSQDELRDQYGDYKIGDIIQSSTGDCSFLSTLNALSQDEDGRVLIKNMINQTEENTWEITFGGAAGKPETYQVTRKHIDDLRAQGIVSNGDWDVALLETAFFKQGMNSGTSPRRSTAADLSLVTGYTIDELHALRREGTQEDDFRNLGMDEKRAYLDNAAKDPDGLVMTVELFNDLYGDGKFRHAYCVTGIDANTQMVTLENPWNSKDPITMSYNQFIGLDALDEQQQQQVGGGIKYPSFQIYHGDIEIEGTNIDGY